MNIEAKNGKTNQKKINFVVRNPPLDDETLRRRINRVKQLITAMEKPGFGRMTQEQMRELEITI